MIHKIKKVGDVDYRLNNFLFTDIVTGNIYWQIKNIESDIHEYIFPTRAIIFQKD